VKIRIKDLELKSATRSADAIVAGQKADQTLAVSIEIDIAGNEIVEDRVEDILQAVRKVTLEALRTKKLIAEDADPETDRKLNMLSQRW
jgi:hypothetical protein